METLKCSPFFQVQVLQKLLNYYTIPVLQNILMSTGCPKPLSLDDKKSVSIRGKKDT